MSEFLYLPPYRQWSLFGTVTVDGSPGVLDAGHEASWLVDGREKFPLRLTTPDGAFEVANPPGEVGVVAFCHHLLAGGVTVDLSGDVSGQIVVPDWPRNGVPYNAWTRLADFTNVSSLIATINGSPANDSDVVIGELLAGAPLVWEHPIRLQGSRFRERQFVGSRVSELSGIPPYSDRARARPFAGSQYYSQAELDEILDWFDSQDGYAYPIPSLIIPDSDNPNDARLVILSEPTYEQIVADPPLYLVQLEFTELPRTRW